MWAQFYRPGPAKRRTFSDWVRQAHRCLAILFTLTVLANFAAMIRGGPPAWITYSPLLPLFLLLFSGLYMFALPYAAKRRRDI